MSLEQGSWGETNENEVQASTTHAADPEKGVVLTPTEVMTTADDSGPESSDDEGSLMFIVAFSFRTGAHRVEGQLCVSCQEAKEAYGIAASKVVDLSDEGEVADLRLTIKDFPLIEDGGSIVLNQHRSYPF